MLDQFQLLSPKLLFDRFRVNLTLSILSDSVKVSISVSVPVSAEVSPYHQVTPSPRLGKCDYVSDEGSDSPNLVTLVYGVASYSPILVGCVVLN